MPPACFADTALWTPRRPPFTPEQMDDLILWIAIGVIGGGRLGHVLFYTPDDADLEPAGRSSGSGKAG